MTDLASIPFSGGRLEDGPRARSGDAASASTRLLEDPEVNQDVARRLGASTGLYVPLLARERPIGVLVAHDKIGPDPRFSSADLRLAEQFANRAADRSRSLAAGRTGCAAAASSRDRSSSDAGSPASCTTRRGRR